MDTNLNEQRQRRHDRRFQAKHGQAQQWDPAILDPCDCMFFFRLHFFFFFFCSSSVVSFFQFPLSLSALVSVRLLSSQWISNSPFRSKSFSSSSFSIVTTAVLGALPRGHHKKGCVYYACNTKLSVFQLNTVI